MSDSKVESGKWVHNKRVSHDKLREGLALLRVGVEEAIKENEKKLAEYQQTLAHLTKPRRVRK